MFLVNVQTFTMNGSEGACDGVCFHLEAVAESAFYKASCLFYKWQ